VVQELSAAATTCEGPPEPAPDPAVVTIKVPFAVRKRGGRKLVLAPDGAPVPPLAPQVNSTLVNAIARAFRWQKMLETGRYPTIKEIANAEKINPSYVSRVLRLTLLAPAIVKATLNTSLYRHRCNPSRRPGKNRSHTSIRRSHILRASPSLEGWMQVVCGWRMHSALGAKANLLHRDHGK
jgi:hypothetical protein